MSIVRGCMGLAALAVSLTLGAALKEAVQVVKRGQPALIDSVTQPR